MVFKSVTKVNQKSVEKMLFNPSSKPISNQSFILNGFKGRKVDYKEKGTPVVLFYGQRKNFVYAVYCFPSTNQSLSQSMYSLTIDTNVPSPGTWKQISHWGFSYKVDISWTPGHSGNEGFTYKQFSIHDKAFITFVVSESTMFTPEIFYRKKKYRLKKLSEVSCLLNNLETKKCTYSYFENNELLKLISVQGVYKGVNYLIFISYDSKIIEPKRFLKSLESFKPESPK